MGQSGQNLVNPQDSSTPPLPSTSAEPVQKTETFTSPEQTPIIEQPKDATNVNIVRRTSLPTPPETTMQQGRGLKPENIGESIKAFGGTLNRAFAEVPRLADWIQTTADDAVLQTVYGLPVAQQAQKLRAEGFDYTTILPNQRPFAAIANFLEDWTDKTVGKLVLPTGKEKGGVIGDIATGTANVLPDIAYASVLASAMPEVLALKAIELATGINLASNFGFEQGIKTAVSKSQQMENGTNLQKVLAPAVGMAEGYAQGYFFENMGTKGNEIGKSIADQVMPKVTTESQAINKAIIQSGGATVSTAGMFGGWGVLDEYRRTGQVSEDTFLSNAGQGMVFGLKDPLRMLLSKGVMAFVGAPRQMINDIANSEIPAEEHAKNAHEKFDAVANGTSTDPEKDLASGKISINTAILKATADQVLNNKDGLILAIKSSTLDTKIKNAIIEKVNAINADNDPKIQETKGIAEKIAKIDDALDDIRDNKSWDEIRKEVESAPLKEKKLSLKEEALKVYGVEPKEQPKGEDGKVKEKPKVVQTESSKKLLDEIDKPKVEQKAETPLIFPKEDLSSQEKLMGEDITDAYLKKQELKGVVGRMKAFTEKHGASLTRQRDIDEYNELAKRILDLKYELRKPLDISKVTSKEERKSVLDPNTVVTAWNDLTKDKPIFDAIRKSAAGVGYDKNTAIDDIIEGKNKDISENKLYDTFENTRKILRDKYGDNITLYRAEGKQKEKSTQNWASTKEGALQYGEKITKKEIPIDNIIALNVGLSGKYEEFIVGNKPIVTEPPQSKSTLSGKESVSDNKAEEITGQIQKDVIEFENKRGRKEDQVSNDDIDKSNTLLERVKGSTDYFSKRVSEILDKYLVFPIKKVTLGYSDAVGYEYAYLPKANENTEVAVRYREFDEKREYGEPVIYDKTIVDKDGNIIDNRYKKYDINYKVSDEIDKDHLFRGMSGQELENTLISGKIESNKNMNFQNQQETTSFAQYERQAFSYAYGFTAWHDNPNFEYPRYVVKIKKEGVDYTINHVGEADVKGSIPISNIVDIYEIRLTEASAGKFEIREKRNGEIEEGSRNSIGSQTAVRKLSTEEVNVRTGNTESKPSEITPIQPQNNASEALTPKSDTNVPPTGDNGQNTSKTEVNEPTRTREIGRKAVEDSTLPDDVKKELTEKGIEYVPRGKKFTDAEAKQIVDLYEGVEGGLDKLSAEVYNTSNGILPDTRTYLNTIIAEKLVAKLNATTDVKEKALLRDKLTDAIIFGAEQGTLGGQLVESQKRWGKVLASDPELMIASVHEKLDRENKEFFSDKQTEVDFVKKTIEDFLKGDEIKKVIDERVRERLLEERPVKLPPEKIKQEQDFRKGKWEELKQAWEAKKKAEGSGSMGFAANAHNELIVDLLGQITRSYIKEKAYTIEDLVYKIQKEFKDLIGEYVDEATIKGMLPKDIKDTKEPAPKVKKPRKEKIKVPPSQEEVVNKLFEKMAKFATRKQMSNFVMDYMEELSAKGVITDPRFRAILAKSLGRDYVSEVTETKITEAAKTLGKANVKSEEYAKSIEDILEEYSKEPTTDEEKGSQKEKLKALEKNAKAIKKDWDKSVFEAEKANQKIKEALNEQPDLISRVGTLIQGGLLIPSSQVANIYGNLAIMPATAPAYLIAGGVDAMYSSAMRLVSKSLQGIDPIAHPDLYHWAAKMGGTERTTLPLEYFKGYWQSAPKQTWKGIQQLKTGATSREMGKGDVQRGVHPIEALGNLFSKDRALVKRIGDLLEALPAGYMAEGQFRLLNLGDKPFRGGAEGGRLRELFELDYRKKVNEAKKLENPQEKAKRLKYLSDTKETSRNKFLSQPDSESLKSAREQGDIATFAQTTQLSKWISSIDKSFKKNGDSTTGSIFGGVARLLKITNTPYVKIPINITMLSAELSCPPISFIKAIDHAIRGDKRAVMDDLGKMVISGALTTVALTFASKGFITTLSDDKDVRAAQLEAGVEEGRLNIDAIRRWIKGEDYSWQDGDRFRSIKRLGIVSVQMMSIAEAYKNMKPEQKDEMKGNTINSGISAMFAALPYMPKMALQQSILVGANNLIQATLGGEAEKDRWLTSQATVLSTTLYPSTVAAISQTVDPEGFLRETRDFSTEEGKIKKHIMNTFKDRLFMGNGLPAKVSIWGQPVMRIPEGEKWSYNLFGISKEKKYQKYSFGTRLFEIYQDYNTTDPDNAKKIFPSLPSATTKVGWNDAKMTPKQYEEYQMKVGTTRAQNAEAYVNSSDWDGASLDDKITELSSIYSKARRYAEAELYSWVNYKNSDETTKSNWELMDKNNALPLPFMGTTIEKVKLTPQEIEQVNNMALRTYAQEIVPYLQSKPETLQTDRTDIDEKTGKSYFIEELNKEWSKALKDAKSDMIDLLEAEKAKDKK